MVTGSVSPAISFARNILQALKLRQEFDQRIDDVNNWRDKNRAVFYAIDPSVLRAYFFPVAQAKDTYMQSMQVFNADGDVRSKLERESVNFASIAARFVIDELCKHVPGLLLNGHISSTATIHSELIGRLAELPHEVRANKKKLRELLQQFSEDGYKADFTMDEALETMWSIYSALKSPHDAAAEFHQLLLTQNVISVNLAANHPSFLKLGSEELHPFIARKDAVYSKAKRLYDTWTDPLFDNLPASSDRVDDEKSQENRALARLFAINRRLNGKAKVVLITLNDDTIKRASNIRDVPSMDALGDNRSFSDKYIRHLRTFLCEPALMAPMNKLRDRTKPIKESVDTDWLDAMLSSFDSNSDVSQFEIDDLLFQPEPQNRLINIVHRALETDIHIHDRFLASWTEHISKVSQKHAFQSQYVSRVLGRLIADEENDENRYLNALQARIDELTENSWTKFYDVSAMAGLDLITRPPSSADIIKRALPSVVFTHHSKASNVANLLVNGMDLEAAKRTIGSQKEILDLEDSTGYTRSIALALLYAFADRWDVADLLSKRAIAVYRKLAKVKDLDDLVESKHEIIDGKLSGREAFFLAGSISRVRATSVAALERSKVLITIAARALDSEKLWAINHAQAKSRVHSLSSTRFDAELASIEVSALMLTLFKARDAKGDSEHSRKLDFDPERRESASEISKSAYRLIKQVLIQLSEEPDRKLRERLELCMLTNLFMVEFARSYAKLDVRRPFTNRELAEKARRTYELNGGDKTWLGDEERKESIVPSRLDRTTSIYAMVAFAEERELPPIGFLRRELNLISFLCRTHNQAVYSTIYDDQRYKALTEFTGELLEARLINSVS